HDKIGLTSTRKLRAGITGTYLDDCREGQQTTQNPGKHLPATQPRLAEAPAKPGQPRRLSRIVRSAITRSHRRGHRFITGLVHAVLLTHGRYADGSPPHSRRSGCRTRPPRRSTTGRRPRAGRRGIRQTPRLAHWPRTTPRTPCRRRLPRTRRADHRTPRREPRRPRWGDRPQATAAQSAEQQTRPPPR